MWLAHLHHHPFHRPLPDRALRHPPQEEHLQRREGQAMVAQDLDGEVAFENEKSQGGAGQPAAGCRLGQDVVEPLATKRRVLVVELGQVKGGRKGHGASSLARHGGSRQRPSLGKRSLDGRRGRGEQYRSSFMDPTSERSRSRSGRMAPSAGRAAISLTALREPGSPGQGPSHLPAPQRHVREIARTAFVSEYPEQAGREPRETRRIGSVRPRRAPRAPPIALADVRLERLDALRLRL